MIIIIGAGLSGLMAGYLLKKNGIQFKILEARDRVGGRINTIFSTNNAPIEMGATWFTSQHKYLIALLKELDIECFEQHIDSKVFYEASSLSPAQLVQIPPQPPSYRISGGSSNLINSLLNKLDKTDILLNQSVKEINYKKNSIEVITGNFYKGNSVILAIPPKLWSNKITFTPPLPNDLMNIAKQTQTWMEDSIKVALTYNQMFWKGENLSGTLFSNSGPITEFYDHSNHERSKYALCGFINSDLKSLTNKERRENVMKQLINVFGKKAENYTSYKECLWSKEANTHETSDIFLSPHQNNGNPIYNNLFYDAKLIISSSESASEFPGYMEGAVHSAYKIVEKLIKGKNANN